MRVPPSKKDFQLLRRLPRSNHHLCNVALALSAALLVVPALWREASSSAFTLAGVTTGGSHGVRHQSLSLSPSPQRRLFASALRAVGDNKASISFVDVQVKRGMEQAFIDATLENARESVNEPTNIRFDLIESLDQRGKYTLIEIYKDPTGPVEHKATEHYARWRDTVADMMLEPRKGTQWEHIFPSKSDYYTPSVLVIERLEPVYFLIKFIDIAVTENSLKDFVLASRQYARDTNKENECMTCTFQVNKDKPSNFRMMMVYQTWGPMGGPEKKHFTEPHFLRWRELVAGMMAKPRVETKWVNIYPNVPIAWKMDPNA